MITPDLLLLRESGSLWGVASDLVHEVVRDRGGVRIELSGGSLLVEGVVGIARGLAVCAGGRVLRAYYPEPYAGITMYAGRPVVVVRPEAPPRVLCSDKGEGPHAS